MDCVVGLLAQGIRELPYQQVKKLTEPYDYSYPQLLRKLRRINQWFADGGVWLHDVEKNILKKARYDEDVWYIETRWGVLKQSQKPDERFSIYYGATFQVITTNVEHKIDGLRYT